MASLPLVLSFLLAFFTALLLSFCKLEMVNMGFQRCLLAEFDLVGGRVGGQDDDGTILGEARSANPSLLVDLTYDQMVEMSSVGVTNTNFICHSCFY